MKIYPFILTNFKRPKYLYNLVQSLKKIQIDNIFIIDNGSNIVNEKYLLDNTTIIKKKMNTGGSAGMCFLFQHLIKNENSNEYNLILDDDLIIDNDYKKNFSLIANFIKSFQDKFMILSRRVNRSEWENQINLGHLNHDISNSIFNWHFIKQNYFKYLKKRPINYDLGRVSLCECDKGHFGGMVIPTNIVNEITPPSSELYLYADDHRFVRLNYKYNKIPLYHASVLKIYDQDVLEKSSTKKKYNLNSAFDPSSNLDTLKFQIRNHFFESLKLKTNKLFHLNILAWMFLNSWKALIKTKNIFFVTKRLYFIYKCLDKGRKLKKLIRD